MSQGWVHIMVHKRAPHIFNSFVYHNIKAKPGIVIIYNPVSVMFNEKDEKKIKKAVTKTHECVRPLDVISIILPSLFLHCPFCFKLCDESKISP